MAKKAKPESVREDANIDTMRRRGRRRLVGAIVLAVFALIFIPVLLEDTPEPAAPEDLSITVVPEPKPPEKMPVAPESESLPLNAPPLNAPPPAAPPPVVQPPVVPPPAPPAAVKPPTPAPTPAPTAPADRNAMPKAVSATAGTFVVQVGSYTDDKGANTVVRRLQSAGYPAYTEPDLQTKKTVWRVRVGAFETEKDAIRVMARLKRDKYNALVIKLR